MIGAAEIVVPAGLLTLAGFWLLPGRHRTERRVTVLLAFMGAMWALGLAETPPLIYSRPRPFEVLHVVKLLHPPPSSSFPSTHVAGAAALATVLGPCLGPWRYLAWALVVGAMVGRVYGGIHYPADVFWGLIVGWIGGALAHYNRDLLRPFAGRLLDGIEELI
jgi:undecaprenyl-diphosphatase